MSVPTKTGREILDECLASVGKDIKKSLDTKYVKLEDHQKDIQRREKLREEYYKDWLSPEQIREKCKILRKDLRKFFNDENENILNEEEMVFRIDEVFGVGGAK